MRSEFGLIFWIYLLVILGVYLSPFVFKYEIIILSIALYYVQLMVFGRCILTIIQFNNSRAKKSFHHYYLEKLGFSVNDKKLTRFLDFVMPWIVLSVSVIWQIWLGMPVLFG